MNEAINPLPLSYSSLTTFENCPWRWYMEKTKQVPRKTGVSALWGLDVHKALELVLNGEQLDERYECYSDYVNVLLTYKDKADMCFIEQKLAVDDQWRACGFDDKHAYIRGIVDFCTIRSDGVAHLIDHKTGNKRETMQLHLQAALVFATYEQVEKITAMFYWMKFDDITVYRFTRDRDFVELCKYFDALVTAVVNDCRTGYYPKRPGPLCRFCSVTACEFYKQLEESYYAS